jgi:glutathione synthase/RimK-type ligase-like ATP-grasp enzyme
LKAAKAMGHGLYGVDLKQLGRRIVVTEVNDNPNIDAGFEDAVLKNELYRRIMQGFLERVERKKLGNGR